MLATVLNRSADLGDSPNEPFEAGTTSSLVPSTEGIGGILEQFPPALFPTAITYVEVRQTATLPPPTLSPVEAASARVNQQASGYVTGFRADLPIEPITTIEATAILRAAGWPEAEIPNMLAIAACESSGGKADADGPLFHPGETGDGGNSLGWGQMWSGWFPAAGLDVERWWDPLENARAMLYVWQTRGHYSGGGGWSCADRLGIP